MKFRFSKDFVVDSDVEPWKSEGIRFAFFSAPGTRKSYTVAACIVEPFLDEGGTVVIFEPRSEWHTLKQRFESVLVVGGPFQDIPLSVNQARLYAEAIVKHGASMVFDFSELEDRDLVRFAAELLARLFTLQNVVRRPLLLFIEEGADYCPFSTKGKTVEPWIYARMVDRIVKIATQGRPLGFALTITSQRPAQLNYTVRMMCNVSFYGKFHPKDLNDIKEVLKPYDVPITETAEKCVNMPHGSWIVIRAEGAEYHSIKAERKTPHGADTPKLEYEAARTEETKQTIDELSKTITEALRKEQAEESELEKAKRKITDLKRKLEVAEEKAKIKLSVKELLEKGAGDPELAEKLAELEMQNKALREQNEQMRKANLNRYHGELEKAQETIKQLEEQLQKTANALVEVKEKADAFQNLQTALAPFLPMPTDMPTAPGFEPGTLPQGQGLSIAEVDERINQRLSESKSITVVKVDVDDRIKELVKNSYVHNLEGKIKDLPAPAVKAALWMHEKKAAKISELYYYMYEKTGRIPGNFYANVVKPLENAWLIVNEAGNVRWILEEKFSTELKDVLRTEDISKIAKYLTSLFL